MKLLAIDPGESMGWAIFNSNKLIAYGTEKLSKPDMPELFEWLTYPGEDTVIDNIDVLVIERYIMRPKSAGGFNHDWNSGFTLQVIGGLKSWAAFNKIKIKEQNSSIKSAASGWATGKPYVKKANQHYLDAVLHGVYYLVKECKVSPGVFRDRT